MEPRVRSACGGECVTGHCFHLSQPHDRLIDAGYVYVWPEEAFSILEGDSETSGKGREDLLVWRECREKQNALQCSLKSNMLGVEKREGWGEERRGCVGNEHPFSSELLPLHGALTPARSAYPCTAHPPLHLSGSTLSDTEGMRTGRAARRGKAKERIHTHVMIMNA